MRTLLAFTLAASLAPMAAHAADMTVTGDTLDVRGVIGMGDGLRLKANLAAADQTNTPVRWVRLASPGGFLSEGLEMAREIRTHHLNTSVAPNAFCASACFLPFAAGWGKVVGANARVGVHSAYGTLTRADDERATTAMAAFAKDLGVPAPILDEMAGKTGDEMGWLSAQELKLMGATVSTVNVMNDWQMPGEATYDAVASAKLKEGSENSQSDVRVAESEASKARFEASPLYKIIMGH